jgi:sarcosine oxidase subunit gamma
MADLARANPLGGEHPFVFTLPGCELRELPLVAKLRVQAMRGEPAAVIAEARSFLGETPNRSQGDDPCILWRAPGDWLAVSSTHSAEELARALGERLAGAPVVLADVSSTSAVLELRGEQALEVMARDCTLDLEGNAVPPGGCAQTTIAQLSVLIHRPGAGDRWRLYVDRTAARHLRDFLVDSARLTIGYAGTR